VEADRSAAPPPSVRSPGVRRRRRRRRRVEGVSWGFWPSSPAFGFVSDAGPPDGADPSSPSDIGASGWGCFVAEREEEDDRRRRDPERLRVRPDGVVDAPDFPDASLVVAASRPAVWSADSSADPLAGSFCVDSCFWAELEPPRLRPRPPRRRRRGRGRTSADPSPAGSAWGSRASSVMQRSFHLGEPEAPIRPPRRATRARGGAGPGGVGRHVTDPARGRRPPLVGLLGNGPGGPDRGVVERGHRSKDTRGIHRFPGSRYLNRRMWTLRRRPTAIQLTIIEVPP
jgi:hypothetical protein